MDSTESRSKSYYVDYTKRGKQHKSRRVGGGTNNARFKEVPDFGLGGQKGFLITSMDEIKSYLEMRNLFEGYFNDIYKPSGINDNVSRIQTTEDELETELKSLRLSRPFKQVRTHCKNAIFLNIVDKFDYVDPILIVDKFFEDMAEKRTSMTGNTYKVLPIIHSFKNNVASARSAIAKVLSSDSYSEDSRKYFIELQARGNYKLKSDDKQRMIEAVADEIGKSKPNWRVDRSDVDYMVVLVVLRDICCLAVVTKYFLRARYNVIEFCKSFTVPDLIVASGQENPQCENQN